MSDAQIGGLIVVAIFGLCLSVIFYDIWKRTWARRKTTEKIDKITATTRDYLETLEHSRMFAAVSVPALAFGARRVCYSTWPRHVGGDYPG